VHAGDGMSVMSQRGDEAVSSPTAGEPAPDGHPRKRTRWLCEAPAHGRFDDRWNEHVRGESRVRRADRNFADILQETRVLQTGVQILFALTVTVAFTGRFGQSDPFARIVYVGTLIAVIAAAALLIGPVAYHRAFFRSGRKRELVERSHQLIRLGLAALVVALTGAMVLVLEVVLPRAPALLIAAALGCGLLLVWFVLPARARRR
jgi:O-antigen/teichoic acid export membrane protein